MYGPFTNEELVGRAIRDRRDRGRARDQVRQRARRRTGSCVGVNGQPEYVRARLRRLAAAARRRPHRPLLPAPRRPDTCRSRRRSARWPSSCGRARCATSASPRRRPRRSAARTRVHPITRAADRVLALEPRPRGRAPADGARARHRLRRVQPARPRLPHRPLPALRGPRAPTTTAASRPRFQGENFAEEPRARRAGRRELAAREGRRRRRSSRSPGCCAQGDDIVPIPGTKRRKYLEENVGAPRPSRSRATTSRASTRSPRRAPPPGTATTRRA